MLRIASENVLSKNNKFLPLIYNNVQKYSTEVNLPSQADVVIIGKLHIYYHNKNILQENILNYKILQEVEV